jgi:hypothetical protein
MAWVKSGSDRRKKGRKRDWNEGMKEGKALPN